MESMQGVGGYGGHGTNGFGYQGQVTKGPLLNGRAGPGPQNGLAERHVTIHRVNTPDGELVTLTLQSQQLGNESVVLRGDQRSVVFSGSPPDDDSISLVIESRGGTCKVGPYHVDRRNNNVSVNLRSVTPPPPRIQDMPAYKEPVYGYGEPFHWQCQRQEEKAKAQLAEALKQDRPRQVEVVGIQGLTVGSN